jgi:hypothetical protein
LLAVSGIPALQADLQCLRVLHVVRRLLLIAG